MLYPLSYEGEGSERSGSGGGGRTASDGRAAILAALAVVVIMGAARTTATQRPANGFGRGRMRQYDWSFSVHAPDHGTAHRDDPRPARSRTTERLGKLDVEPPATISLERPARREHGDWSSNVALASAKQAERNPRELATQLAELLSGDPPPTSPRSRSQARGS